MLQLIKSIFMSEKNETEATDDIFNGLLINKDEIEQKDSVIESSEEISMKLSLHSDSESIISDIRFRYLMREVEELPAVKRGDIKLVGLYAFDQKEAMEVKFYICNGLDKGISFEDIPLAIVNSKNQVLAEQSFDLRDLGVIPAYSARPWEVYFEKENVFAKEIDKDDWELIFNIHKS